MSHPPHAAAVNGAKRILSVDDEPGVLDTRQMLLQREGYSVLSAADGSEALQLFAEEAVDLVLLDYVMPGMDGGAIARAIKNQRPQVPVIIVSASPVPEEYCDCVDDFVPKGEGPALLLAKVKRQLSAISL